MRRFLVVAAWLAAAGLGLALLVWAYPRAFPFLPERFELSRAEVLARAEAHLLELGEPVRDPYTVVRIRFDRSLLGRMQLEGVDAGAEETRRSRLARRAAQWEVVVYEPGTAYGEWTYRARLDFEGNFTALRVRTEAERREVGPPPSAEEAGARASDLLRRHGFDLAAYGEPRVETREQRGEVRTVVRYTDSELLLGPDFPYGLEVLFLGDELQGFEAWFEEPRRQEVGRLLQGWAVRNQAQFLLLLLLVPVMGVLFLRRYHAGEIGVKRPLQIFALTMACAVLSVAAAARAASEAIDFGILTRAQQTLAWGVQGVVIFFLPIGLLALLSWSVGEVHARERWGRKLAAFDALFRGAWANATVARAAVQGPLAGLALTGGTVALLATLQAHGAWVQPDETFGWWAGSRWLGLWLALATLTFVLFYELFGRLLLVSWGVERLGRWLGPLFAAVVASLVVFPFIDVLPAAWGVALWFVVSLVLVGLFLKTDLLTVLLASLTLQLLMVIYPLLVAGHPWLQLQGLIALAVPLLPAVVSLRHLGSGRELEYRYEDVPPHVRRIAERERHRLELETARRIQGSILPALPARLDGVELAYAYRPATEVGGDFYDVVPLADGRLAVALGDVAGHGVSSGLIMAALKSAFEVQVRYDPEPDAVFSNLNRLVLEAAGKRFLATLSYGLIDPSRRRLRYASAGHLFPYRIARDGTVEPLESIAYPLGVRDELRVKVRETALAPGDLLVFFSDGIVEARRRETDEMFGFERVERGLAGCTGATPAEVRDRLLAAAADFAGDGAADDDLTLLVLRIP